MKKILVSVFVAIMTLCGCSVTQEMKENASFAGLNKVYVEQPVGVSEIFNKRGNTEFVTQNLKDAVEANLKTKGFEIVPERKDAEIVFRPLLSASYNQPEYATNESIFKTTQEAPIGTTLSSKLYVTLEIQAILPKTDDLWSWRGFSPEMMSIDNFTTSSITRQVFWCLEYFPPEKNPDRLSQIKKERKERQIKAEENPFKEVLIKDREQKKSI